jgi:hypothetical protein
LPLGGVDTGAACYRDAHPYLHRVPAALFNHGG